MSKDNGLQKITLSDGSWVKMRPMNIDDMLAFAEVDKDFGSAIRAVKDGIVDAQFKNGKPFGEQPVPVYNEVLKAWNQAEDEVALPPASAPPSA
jgi:hypothetical protein